MFGRNARCHRACGRAIERNRSVLARSVWHLACVRCDDRDRNPPVNEAAMDRVLVIDRRCATTRTLGLACLQRGIGVAFAHNVGDGVCVLLDAPVDLIVLDVTALQPTPREVAMLVRYVAPGVPLAVTVRPETPLEDRVALELGGFRVLAHPLGVDELIEKAWDV
jgi:DNA-binding NtrC family response regulator